MKTYKWKYKDNMSNNYYHDEGGRIVGEITRVNFSDDIWFAEVEKIKIGEYIDNRSARQAVESKVVCFDKLDTIFNMTPATEDFNPREDYTNGYSGSSDATATWNSGNNSQLGENH